jgi:hypothetical protein
VVTLLVAGLLAGAAGWVAVRFLQTPAVERVAFDPADGARAQRKIFDVARRATAGPVVLSEAEINAFVTRHLDPADLPLRDVVIRLRGENDVEIVGAMPLGRLLRESPLTPLAGMLPGAWLARPIWLRLTVRASVVTEPRHALRLEPRRLAIGRQRVPPTVLRLALDPSSLRLTRITLPPDVRDVRVERGRVVIQTTSSRGRT